MDALSIITLQQAKEYLAVDFPDHDETITTAIKTAIGWVERYTSYALYERTEGIPALSVCNQIYTFPITVTSVVNSDSVAQTYKVRNQVQSILVETSCLENQIINVTVGYTSVNDIPEALLSACYKLLTYLYLNRDEYDYSIPTDIQMLINQYRRHLV